MLISSNDCSRLFALKNREKHPISVKGPQNRPYFISVKGSRKRLLKTSFPSKDCKKRWHSLSKKFVKGSGDRCDFCQWIAKTLDFCERIVEKTWILPKKWKVDFCQMISKNLWFSSNDCKEDTISIKDHRKSAISVKKSQKKHKFRYKNFIKYFDFVQKSQFLSESCRKKKMQILGKGEFRHRVVKMHVCMCSPRLSGGGRGFKKFSVLANFQIQLQK